MDQVSLARVSVVAPVCSRRTAAAAADGASPRTVPPSSVQAAARARMAVVFPAPAGAIASWSRAPEVAISRDQGGLSGVEGDPVGGLLEQRQLDRVRAGAVPVATAGGVDEALLGGQDPRCRCTRRTRRPRRRWTRRCGAARPARRCRRRSGSGAPRRRSRTWSTTRSTTASTCSAGRFAARTWRCASARTCQTCQVERRACDLVADPRGGVPHPRRIHRAGVVLRGRRTGPRPPSRDTPAGPPRTSSASLAPGGALLGQGARFVLGVAGLQGGLLGQLDRLHHGRRAAVVGLERGRRARRGGPRCAARRVDQRWFRRGSTPTTSRTGRLPALGARHARRRPARAGSRRCFSRAVL